MLTQRMNWASGVGFLLSSFTLCWHFRWTLAFCCCQRWVQCSILDELSLKKIMAGFLIFMFQQNIRVLPLCFILKLGFTKQLKNILNCMTCSYLEHTSCKGGRNKYENNLTLLYVKLVNMEIFFYSVLFLLVSARSFLAHEFLRLYFATVKQSW